MLPTQLPVPPGGMPPGGAPASGGAPTGGGGENPSPDEIRAMLVQVLSKAKQLADQNGINFQELLAGVEGNAAKPVTPAPTAPPV